MAINKVVNKSAKSHGAMRNVLEYVMRDQKIREGYVEISGPYSGENINYDDVYRTWLNEKQLWDKDSGRMYAHFIISFHKDEPVTPADVLDICRSHADHFFSGHQYVIGVHQDKDHLHGHIVVNSVSYIDGHKLHQTKHDLEEQKNYTNNLCRERGLTVAEKGRHFDGSLIEQGEISTWSKDKYNLLITTSTKSCLGLSFQCIISVHCTLHKLCVSMQKERSSLSRRYLDHSGYRLVVTRLFMILYDMIPFYHLPVVLPFLSYQQ